MSETTDTINEVPTEEQLAAAREYMAAVRQQAIEAIDNTVDYLVDNRDYRINEAMNEIAIQAIVRSIMLFRLLTPELQEQMAALPLISLPPEVLDEVEDDDA